MAPIQLSENFRAFFYAPFYAASARDAYAAEGVEVTLLESPDPTVSSGALRAGRLDVAWGGPYRVILDHARRPESDLVSFCNVVERDPFFIVGRTPRPDFKFADLKDCAFGTVSEVPTPWICLQDDLRRAGVDPESLTRTTDASMADNAAALAAGRLDAIQVFQPYAEALVESGDGHIWLASADRGLTAYTTLNTRRAVIAEREDDLKAMTRAIGKTLAWVAAAPADEIAATVAPFFPDIPRDRAARIIQRYRDLNLWARSPVIPEESFHRLAAAMQSGGVIDAAPTWADCVDVSLAAAASPAKP